MNLAYKSANSKGRLELRSISEEFDYNFINRDNSIINYNNILSKIKDSAMDLKNRNIVDDSYKDYRIAAIINDFGLGYNYITPKLCSNSKINYTNYLNDLSGPSRRKYKTIWASSDNRFDYARNDNIPFKVYEDEYYYRDKIKDNIYKLFLINKLEDKYG